MIQDHFYWRDIYDRIVKDPRYLEGLMYGKPRKGHEEGSVANHLVDLDVTLLTLQKSCYWLGPTAFWKLKVLIHVHDSFKLEGKRRTGHQVSLRDPNSHASLARDFLAEFTANPYMLAIVQYHDEGHALWQQEQKTGIYNEQRLTEALEAISPGCIASQKSDHIDFYLVFTIIDGYTPSKLKDRSPRWFVSVVNKHVKTEMAQIALRVLGI